MEIAMRYEMSEAAAACAMLGAVVSIGVWIFGLFYSGTILENLFSNGWLLALGGILYYQQSHHRAHRKAEKGGRIAAVPVKGRGSAPTVGSGITSP
jgi:hypothetical protein